MCDDSWDFDDANVVCRQLGYHGAENIYAEFSTVDFNVPILLDNTACRGYETTLLNCAGEWGHDMHNCDHLEDAGVQCNPNMGKFTNNIRPRKKKRYVSTSRAHSF